MRRAWWLASVAVLAACADGYPQEDAPLLDESAMSTAQLLTTLNTVGSRPHLDAGYRYALASGCVLQIDSGTRRAPERAALPLAVVDIEIRTVDGPQGWQVLLRPDATAGQAPALLLQGGKWADAVQARSLVQQLQRRCAAAALKSPSGSGPG